MANNPAITKIRLPPDSNRKINAKSVFILYLQLKSHFNGKYDVIKYDWKMNVSDKAFDKRPDKIFFRKLSEKYSLSELVYIFVSNLATNQNAWVGEISDSDSLSHYREYIGRMKSSTDNFTSDLNSIYIFYKKLELNSFKDIFTYNKDINNSYIFRLLQSGIITTETFIILDSLLNIIERMDEHDNIIWSTYSNRLKAYRKLLIFDREYYKILFKETLKNMAY